MGGDFRTTSRVR